MVSKLAEVADGNRSGSTIEVELVRGRDVLSQLAPAWSAAAIEHPRASPFAHPEWTRVWLESFAPDAELLIVHARSEDGHLGFAPLVERGRRLLGMTFRVWQTPANEHSQRTDWTVPVDGEAVVRAMWRRLRDSDGWDILLLPNLVEGGLVDATLGRVAEADGHFVHREPSLQSPWLPVPSPGQLDAALSSKFRANLRRRRRKLSAAGEITLERAERGPAALALLRAGFALEASGWKGDQGTAIASSPQTLQFYTALARAFEARGWLSLYLLRVGGRPVAFHFALTYGGRYQVLKPAYDEALAACSPGQLLVEDVLRDLHRRGVEVFDFLGPSMTWKLDWTDRICGHCGTWVIRPSMRGRVLARHFGARSWAKSILKEARRWSP